MKKLVLTLDKNSDKRKKKRIEIFSNISGQLDVLGISTQARVSDVSYSGFGLIVPNMDEVQLTETLEAKVGLLNQFFNGRIASKIVLPNKEIKLGISLPAQVDREVDFNNLDASWDKVRDPEIVKNIYNDLVFKGPEAPIELKQNFARVKLIPQELTTNDSIICEIFEITRGALEKGKAKCMFDLFQTCHAFDSNVDRIDTTKVEIKISPVLARLLRRETTRVPNLHEKSDVAVFLRSRSLNQEISGFKLFDYSEHGISLLDPEGDLSLPRNLLFEEVVIHITNAGSIFGYGEIRSYVWKENLNAYVIGLQFRPYGEPHVTNWHNFILKERYPALDFQYKSDDHSKIWSLFKDSGYLAIKDESAFDDVYDYTQKTWKLLSEAGSKISRRILIRGENRVLAHLQMDRMYPNTWYLHHLAVAPDVFKTISNDIYAVTSDVFFAEQSMFVLTLTDIDKKWNQKNYYNFIENYPFPEHHDMKNFFMFEVDLNKKNTLIDKSECEVLDAGDYDLVRIKRYFEVNFSRLVNDAYSFTDDLLLENFNKEVSKFNLVRYRKFLVAKINGLPVGFAQIEVSLSGINILSYFDMVYVYFFDSCAEADKEIVRDKLLVETIKYYQSIGKTKVTAILDAVDPIQYDTKGLRYLCEDVRWISITSISKKYQAYTKNLYGNLLLRRLKIRKKNEKA